MYFPKLDNYFKHKKVPVFDFSYRHDILKSNMVEIKSILTPTIHKRFCTACRSRQYTVYMFLNQTWRTSDGIIHLAKREYTNLV